MAKAGFYIAAFVHRAKATVQNSLIFLPTLKQLYNELFFFTGALARCKKELKKLFLFFINYKTIFLNELIVFILPSFRFMMLFLS